MNIYTDVRDLLYAKINNPQGILEVFNSYEIKEELKARGYKFDAGTKAWGKHLPAGQDAQIVFLREELSFLDGKAAIEAYSTLDFLMMSVSGLPVRERKLRKGEWETSNDQTALKRLLGDAGIDDTNRRGIYESLCRINKNNARRPFEESAEISHRRLLFDGGLISEEAMMEEV